VATKGDSTEWGICFTGTIVRVFCGGLLDHFWAHPEPFNDSCKGYGKWYCGHPRFPCPLWPRHRCPCYSCYYCNLSYERDNVRAADIGIGLLGGSQSRTDQPGRVRLGV